MKYPYKSFRFSDRPSAEPPEQKYSVALAVNNVGTSFRLP